MSIAMANREKDFSVIIRGLYDSEVGEVIKNLNKKYECEIVYSTWDTWSPKEARLPKKVKIVLSTDPGPGPIQNLNRQIKLVDAALKRCTNEKIFMCRSDINFDTIPFFRYQEDAVFWSSIMSVIYGHPCPEAALMEREFFMAGTKREYYCRFGDWYHMGSKVNIADLYAPCTEQEIVQFKQAFPDYMRNGNPQTACIEQFLFHRYMSKRANDYIEFILNHVRIMDISELNGKITKDIYKNKRDVEYHNSSKHKKLLHILRTNRTRSAQSWQLSYKANRPRTPRST